MAIEIVNVVASIVSCFCVRVVVGVAVGSWASVGRSVGCHHVARRHSRTRPSSVPTVLCRRSCGVLVVRCRVCRSVVHHSVARRLSTALCARRVAVFSFAGLSVVLHCHSLCVYGVLFCILVWLHCHDHDGASIVFVARHALSGCVAHWQWHCHLEWTQTTQRCEIRHSSTSLTC